MKEDNVFGTIILEAFCSRKWSIEKHKYMYRWTNHETYKFVKTPNPFYNPKYRTPRKPRYCPNVPSYLCLEKECPHLCYVNAEPEEYEHDAKYWAKESENEK